jgi:hypothetical protein
MRFVVFPDPFDALVHARVVDMIISADTPQQAAEKSRYLGPVRVINVESGWLYEVEEKRERIIKEVRP